MGYNINDCLIKSEKRESIHVVCTITNTDKTCVSSHKLPLHFGPNGLIGKGATDLKVCDGWYID